MERPHVYGRRGARVLLLAVNNHATKLAHRMALALLRPQDELQIVTVVSSDDSRPDADAMLQPLAMQPLPGGGAAVAVVLAKGDARLGDVIAGYAESCGADLVVCGSHHLCKRGTRDDPMPASGSFALRLVRAVRCCPLLVVKSNTAGAYLAHGSTAAGLRVLVDCTPTARHLLSWLMDRLDPASATIFLAVSRAFDQDTGMATEAARRMLTNFSVQAGVGEFYAAQRLLKDHGAKALPEAARVDGVDVIVLQAPACKALPQSLVDVLHVARTSVLVFNPPQRDGRSAERADDDLSAAAPPDGAVAAAAAATTADVAAVAPACEVPQAAAGAVAEAAVGGTAAQRGSS